MTILDMAALSCQDAALKVRGHRVLVQRTGHSSRRKQAHDRHWIHDLEQRLSKLPQYRLADDFSERVLQRLDQQQTCPATMPRHSEQPTNGLSVQAL